MTTQTQNTTARTVSGTSFMSPTDDTLLGGGVYYGPTVFVFEPGKLSTSEVIGVVDHALVAVGEGKTDAEALIEDLIEGDVNVQAFAQRLVHFNRSNDMVDFISPSQLRLLLNRQALDTTELNAMLVRRTLENQHIGTLVGLAHEHAVHSVQPSGRSNRKLNGERLARFA